VLGNYSKLNTIKYDIIDKSISDLTGSDTFTGDGVGVKEAVKIESKLPKFYDDAYPGYDMLEDLSGNDIVIMTLGGDGNPVSFEGGSKVNTISSAATILSMSGYYSTILNPIFANPVILNAEGYIEPFSANKIMTDKIIESIKLGGRYWVWISPV